MHMNITTILISKEKSLVPLGLWSLAILGYFLFGWNLFYCPTLYLLVHFDSVLFSQEAFVGRIEVAVGVQFVVAKKRLFRAAEWTFKFFFIS